jgi:hypothetical protein
MVQVTRTIEHFVSRLFDPTVLAVFEVVLVQQVVLVCDNLRQRQPRLLYLTVVAGLRNCIRSQTRNLRLDCHNSHLFSAFRSRFLVFHLNVLNLSIAGSSLLRSFLFFQSRLNTMLFLFKVYIGGFPGRLGKSSANEGLRGEKWVLK